MIKISLMVVLILGSICVRAGVTGNGSIVSDYVWRGQTATDHGAAMQGGLDYSSDFGVTVGSWGSNVAGGGTEVDFILSYSYKVNDNLSISVGDTFYHYPKSGVSDTNEFNLGVDFFGVGFSANYILDYFGKDISSWYFALSKKVFTCDKHKLSLALDVGYTTFEKEELAGSKNYLDYKISINKEFENKTFAFFYSNSDRESYDGITTAEVDDRVAGVSLSFDF